MPYVGATTKNNGIMGFVEAKSNLTTDGNCIAFICDGQGSVGLSIYKAENFIGSTTIRSGRVLGLNRYNAHFLVGVLDKNRRIYNYGYKRTTARLENEVILLPVDEHGEPDYAYMEQYSKQLVHMKYQQYFHYIANREKQLLL